MEEDRPLVTQGTVVSRAEDTVVAVVEYSTVEDVVAVEAE